jgi:hypothetical protein
MHRRTKYERGFSLIAVVLIAFGLILPTFGSDRAESNLTFGMSTALTGPAAELGVNMRAGEEAAFAERNRQGGVRGRRLKLIVLDDGFDIGLEEPLMLGPEHHQACYTVWPTDVQHGTITPCQRTILKSTRGGQSDVTEQE